MRIASGKGEGQDQANVDYATKNFGYKYTPNTPVAPTTPVGPEMITGYDPSGNPVQVERGKYVPGISLTPPATPATPPVTNTPAPAIPEVPASPYDTPEYNAASEAYQNALKLSPEEIANQEALDRLNASFATGQTETSNQAIPMEFITGQNKAIEDRALALAQPIQAKAALLQAKRLASIDASKFALEQEAGKISEAEAAKSPVAVGAGTSLIDPKTGKAIYTPPETPQSYEDFTLSPGQKRYDAFGNEIASVPDEAVGGADGGTAESWIDLIQKGKAKLSDVPQEIRNSVAMGLSDSPALTQVSKDAIAQANVVMGAIDEALPEINNFTAGIGGATLRNVPGTQAYNLDKTIDTIKANVGFQALQAMRNASPTGGALGQVSENENKLLQSTLASLDTGQSPEQLKANLNKVKLHFNNLIANLNSAAAEVSGDDEFNW